MILLSIISNSLFSNANSNIALAYLSEVSDEKDLFTGEIWIGKSAIDVGLVDGIGHLKPILEEKFGKKLKVNMFGPKRSIFQKFGAKLLANNIKQLNNEALWARFGL